MTFQKSCGIIQSEIRNQKSLFFDIKRIMQKTGEYMYSLKETSNIAEERNKIQSNLYDFSTGKLVEVEDSKGKEPPKHSNKAKGKKSEVYALKIEDVKKIFDYFEENQLWQYQLMFSLQIFMGRRAGDTLSLKWKDFFNPANGNFYDNIEIVEQKTEKIATPRIAEPCREFLLSYIEHMGIDPSKNNYENPIFLQTTGNYKGRVVKVDSYRKVLKRAGEAVGIPYNIGTHSARKFFGMMCKVLHPNDPRSTEVLQTILNHSSAKITLRYIGLEKEYIDKYYDDMGEFYKNYIIGDGKCEFQNDTPVVYIDSNSLRDILQQAYQAGLDNAGNADPKIHLVAFNEIMGLVDKERIKT